MEVSVKKNIISAKHRITKNELFKIKKGKNIQSILIYKKPQICSGYSSKTSDNKHILMLDWDECAYSVIEDDIAYIQDKFNLPTAYIFFTNKYKKHNELLGSFHAVFLCKLKIDEILDIMSFAHIDENFKTSPIRNIYRGWVLRLSKKKNRNRPKFYKLIYGKNNGWEISSAHKTLLSKFYKNIKHPDYKNEDNLKIVRIQTYETFK